jgi:hypothetical protein
VLFTAQAYADRLAAAGLDSSGSQQAVDKLARLVRCPHLSMFWLSASVLSDDASRLLLGRMPQLKQLLLLKMANSTDALLRADNIQKRVWGVPASWLLPVRDSQQVNRAQLEWEVDVAAIRQALSCGTGKCKAAAQEDSEFTNELHAGRGQVEP